MKYRIGTKVKSRNDPSLVWTIIDSAEPEGQRGDGQEIPNYVLELEQDYSIYPEKRPYKYLWEDYMEDTYDIILNDLPEELFTI
jgi:hypothetical protein